MKLSPHESSTRRELVFRAWTDAEQVVKWWGPNGFTTTSLEFDLRPGGAWRLVMHGPNGTDYPGEFRFVEIASPERLVLDHVTLPKFRLKIVFDDLNGKTKISFRQLFETSETYRSVKHLALPGNEQLFDKFAAELAAMGAGSHEMLMSRVVMAPRELVWKAWTEPEHLAKWWGPRGFLCPRCELDLRVGGKLRVDMQHPDGTVRPMVGQFLEIVPPERLVFTAMPLDPSGKPFFEATNAVDFRQEGPMTLHQRAGNGREDPRPDHPPFPDRPRAGLVRKSLPSGRCVRRNVRVGERKSLFAAHSE